MSRSQYTDEPSMEDLLASIRRAIHEEEGLAPPAAEPRFIPRMPAGPAVVPSVAVDISALREKIHQELSPERPRVTPAPPAPPVSSPADRTRNFTGVFNTPRPVAQPAPARAPAPQRPAAPAPGLTSPRAAESAAFAFDRLSRTSAVPPTTPMLTRLQAERSFEEITREMLQPMLKQWLDRHLPALVERLVKAEIERIARRGR